MIKYLGQTKRESWECFSWLFEINGERFEYFTGLGHATKPKIKWGPRPLTLKNKKTVIDKDKHGDQIYVHVPKLKDLLYSLAMDAQCGQETFEDFCGNMGYDTDSRKALETYLKCQDANTKLRKVLKSSNAVERINAWEL